MRTFIHYGPNGEVIAVARVEVMPAELPNPINVMDESQGVIELDKSDPLAAKSGRELHAEFVVDMKSKRLRKGTTKATVESPTPAPPAPPAPPPPKGGTPGETPPTRPVPEAEEM